MTNKLTETVKRPKRKTERTVKGPKKPQRGKPQESDRYEDNESERGENK